jgi:hypothetical protein
MTDTPGHSLAINYDGQRNDFRFFMEVRCFGLAWVVTMSRPSLNCSAVAYSKQLTFTSHAVADALTNKWQWERAVTHALAFHFAACETTANSTAFTLTALALDQRSMHRLEAVQTQD